MPSYIEKAEQISLPVIPLQGTVAFPSIAINFEINDEKSLAAARIAGEASSLVFLPAYSELVKKKRGGGEDFPFYTVGTVAKIRQLLRTPEGQTRILAEGMARATVIRYEDGETWVDVADDTIVSMNMWGFMPSFLEEITNRFHTFLETTLVENPLKGEYFLPLPVSQLIEEGKATVKVLTSADRWYGVTYAADKPVVMDALHTMQEQGLYPDGLWG